MRPPRNRSSRGTPDLLDHHKINALRLRDEARRAMWRRLRLWLRDLLLGTTRWIRSLRALGRHVR